MQANSAVQVSGASGTAASTNIEALTAARVSSAPLADVLRLTDTTVEGLSDAEASTRLVRYGPNSVRTQRVSAIAVLGRQLRSAVLGLLAATAVLSFFLGDSKQAIIIGKASESSDRSAGTTRCATADQGHSFDDGSAGPIVDDDAAVDLAAFHSAEHFVDVVKFRAGHRRVD